MNIMKRLSILFLMVLVCGMATARQAKYVFYFIGDGMGLNHVNATEMYLAELEGRIGTKSLLMTTFPVTTYATSFSASNSVTDSSAGGTALATGVKTYNGAIGVDKDKNPIRSIAERAKASGRRVGIATSVSVDHATPSAFYAHQESRKYYYEIALDLPRAGFDFYAGSGFLRPDKNREKMDAPSIYPIFEEAGYTVVRGIDEFESRKDAAQKMILIQKEGVEPSALTYAIDRQEGDLTLEEITEGAIDFLSKDKRKGFFLVVEGGKIDWASHSNDAATMFAEVVDFDNAIRKAYEFYKKHPKETLIVVTADHETGGLGMASGGSYELNLKVLASQKQSQDALSHSVTDLRKKHKVVKWEEMKQLLTEKMGFWKDVKLTWNQEKRLRDAFEESFKDGNVEFKESLYSRTEPVAAVAIHVINEIALLGWTTGGHSAAYVPVYAIGAGQELFEGKMDNIEIPQRIAKAAGYKW